MSKLANEQVRELQPEYKIYTRIYLFKFLYKVIVKQGLKFMLKKFNIKDKMFGNYFVSRGIGTTLNYFPKGVICPHLVLRVNGKLPLKIQHSHAISEEAH